MAKSSTAGSLAFLREGRAEINDAGCRGLVRRVAALGAETSGGSERGRTGGERLYVSRARARRRRVVNEESLWALLEARGFHRVFLEDMTWAEQIVAFREARELVAAHGAGLANLVFCEAGTRVVEFFDRAYVNPCYWRLAALKGLDYRPLVPAGDVALTQTLSANRNDLTADLARIARALE